MDDLLNWGIHLLRDIDSSCEKKVWCGCYTACVQSREQEDLNKQLDMLMDRCHENGLVITNDAQVARVYGLSDSQLENPELDSMTYLEVLCSIAWHLKRNNFIGKSIASGILLRLFVRLRELQPGPYVVTTLDTLYQLNCGNVPREKGVYRVLLPDQMEVVFSDQCQNQAAPIYPVEKLMDKYSRCKEREVLYIGKANGRNGLQQRLRQYMKYGWNESANHKGGRAIWQIENFGLLLLEYEPCGNCEQREHELLRSYKEKNGCYPLANWRG